MQVIQSFTVLLFLSSIISVRVDAYTNSYFIWRHLTSLMHTNDGWRFCFDNTHEIKGNVLFPEAHPLNSVYFVFITLHSLSRNRKIKSRQNQMPHSRKSDSIWQNPTVSDKIRPYMTKSDHIWQNQTVSDKIRPYPDKIKPYMTKSDHIWQNPTVTDKIWLYLTKSDRIWQNSTVSDKIRPYLAVRTTRYFLSISMPLNVCIFDQSRFKSAKGPMNRKNPIIYKKPINHYAASWFPQNTDF